MKTEELIRRKFEELEEQYSKARTLGLGMPPYGLGIEGEDWERWFASALNLLRSLGPDLPHYGNLKRIYDDKSTMRAQKDFQAAFGVLSAAKSDFEGGYLISLESAISGEVLGDFVGLAKRSLQEGYKDVAAVLACAAIEDALKRYARLQHLDVADVEMREVVNALKAKGLVSGAQRSLLDTMPRIRNYAMHANWDKISQTDVGSVIGFVEQFLLSRFG